MSEEKCQKCGELGEDRRTLWMACFYDMGELLLPFEAVILQEAEFEKKFYTLRVCKECRGSWMGAIQEWFHSKPEVENVHGTGIFIREHGAIKEISREEWDKKHPGQDPVVYRGEVK